MWLGNDTRSAVPVQMNAFSTSDILVCGNSFCAGDEIEKNEMGWVCSAYG